MVSVTVHHIIFFQIGGSREDNIRKLRSSLMNCSVTMTKSSFRKQSLKLLESGADATGLNIEIQATRMLGS